MKYSFRSLFTLDLRSIALMRIAIAITIITDLVIRSMDIQAHYTDRGILPLEALHRYFWSPYYFSIYAAGTSYPVEIILFGLHFICAFGLLLGYRTKITTILCWVFALSVHNRNPLIEQAGDDFLRLMLFWFIFLPWGNYYSLDALKKERPKDEPTEYISIAGFAYICQIAFLYFFSALLKSSPEWTTDFTAIYYALSLDQILTPIGKFMYGLKPLLKPLTAAVFYTEFFLPFILFIPIYNSYLRMIFIVVIALMHIGINLCLNVGLFSLISIVGLIGLIPKDFMDRIAQWPFFLRSKNFISGMLQKMAKTEGKKLSFFPKENWMITLFTAFILIYITLWNVGNLGKKLLPHKMYWIAQLLRIDQYWGMFAPSVFKDDGWFILLGKTKSGKEIDIAKGDQKVDYTKPSYAADFYKNDRWRKYHENILLISKSNMRPYYCNYLLWHWNSTHPTDSIVRLDIIYMKEFSMPDYQKAVPKREVLCWCSLSEN